MQNQLQKRKSSESYSNDSLIKLGVNILTGEACAYGRRLLCDLNKYGVENMAKFLGVFPDAFKESLPDNMNSSVQNAGDAVKSMMLSRDTLREFWEFHMIDANCIGFVLSENTGMSTVAVFNNDTFEEYSKQPDLFSVQPNYYYNKFKDPDVTVGDRNVHQATGRVY